MARYEIDIPSDEVQATLLLLLNMLGRGQGTGVQQPP